MVTSKLPIGHIKPFNPMKASEAGFTFSGCQSTDSGKGIHQSQRSGPAATWSKHAVVVAAIGWLTWAPEGEGEVLFEDQFDAGIPGWTVVQPPGAYLDGPLRWEYDIVANAFVEQSNIYTDSATSSSTATAPMLVNDTVTAVNFALSGRLTAGDDDGFGLIFGYQNPTNFYRVTFARQARTSGFPWTGWSVDRKLDGITTNLFGAGMPGYTQTFVNTANRPFDVTISVDTFNRFSLRVVDNPAGSPTTYELVKDQVLPAPANGRVGLVTWGMSGGVPKGFRIQNLQLSPQPLAGNPNALGRWTALVPPRANGSTAVANGHGQPLWSLGMTAQGPHSALVESSDCFAGNDASGQVDFTGPTLVAGDPGWTDYVIAARILPFDDDAQGILLRFRNPSNFCRVSLRSQASTIGPRRGLAVQRVVNGIYSEVFRENVVQYDPLPGKVYDLIASIDGETLDVTLVSEPEGPATIFSYGPLKLSGLPTGNIGLFSWGMARTDFDWVTVQVGAPLYVSSPHGTCSPTRGLHTYQHGTTVTATVEPAADIPGVRHSPYGWMGSGSVPPLGTGTNVTFTLNSFSRVQWLWRTEFRLDVSSEPGGTVTPSGTGWHESGSTAFVSAVPHTGFTFVGWRGTVASAGSVLNLMMDQPHEIVATFAVDSDGDTLPDDWEMYYFGSLEATAEGDPDRDGRTTTQEFGNGTHPLVPDILRIEDIELNGEWYSLMVSNNTGSRYNVETASDVQGSWTIQATAQHTNRYVSSLVSGAEVYWRLYQPAVPAEVLPFVPGSWTLVVLPDTQMYSMNYPDLFLDQTRWIVANKTRHNIKYVLHLGDITNNNTPEQWDRARQAMALLDGEVPYAFVPGNHDYGPNGGTADRTTHLNDYFSTVNYLSWPSFGGLMTPGRMDNSYHLFSAGGVEWIVLALEFGPRDSVLTWANSVVANYPGRRAILITHAYLYNDDTRYDWAVKGSGQSWNPHAYGVAGDPDGVNDGEELWQKLVKGNPGFALVMNGHVLNDGLGRLSSTNDVGGTVHQMLVNYQMKTLGGESYLRLVEFLPDGRTIQVRAYSPLRGAYKTDSQNQFTLTLNPPLK